MKKNNENKKLLIDSAKKYIATILSSTGENIERDGLQETPARIIKMYQELLSGYKVNDKSIFKKFDSNGFQGLVIVTDIHFYSLCEHHLLPFYGEAHIGYIPNGKILGLSKFSRLVDVYARRLQTQENLTNQIAGSIQRNLNPVGHIVLITAEHLCMSMRGVSKKGVFTKTLSAGGILQNNMKLQKQFYLQLDALRRNERR